MAGNVEFTQLMNIPPRTLCHHDHDDNANTIPCDSLAFCPGRTDALEDSDHGWDNLAFGNDAHPPSISAMLELNSHRGLSIREFVALSWPMHYASLGETLSTDYLSRIILMDPGVDCGDVLTCGLKDHPELRVWVDYYVNFGDRVFARDVADVWVKMMNVDRFDGPTGNVCDEIRARGDLYIMQMMKKLGDDDDTSVPKLAVSITPMTSFTNHLLSSIVEMSSTDGIVISLLTLITWVGLVFAGIWAAFKFTRK